MSCDCGMILHVRTEMWGAEDMVFYVGGEYLGFPCFLIDDFHGVSFSMWFDGTWHLTYGNILEGENNGELAYLKNHEAPCPETLGEYFWDVNMNKWSFRIYDSVGIACKKERCRTEDRFQKTFKSIKLPENFQEEERGLKDCCCEQIVLGSGSEKSWENDLTSCWIKLSSLSDDVQFYLQNETGQQIFLDSNQFVNEPNAFYATVNWGEILQNFGEGCYELVIEYNISGVIGTVNWGEYKLKPYSIENALKTARVSAIFDGYHEIEGINFSGSNVPSTFRFYGFIGFRQPNYEIDNLIYGDRQMKRNLRENLNAYDIITDPADECIIRPLVELYLLSENELFISDYNAHNHSYRYLDLPVIVQESPKIDYTDKFSRKAVLTCTVGDKFKNKRTYY